MMTKFNKSKATRASGAGVKPRDTNLPLTRHQVLLDSNSKIALLKIGDGNLSLGIREAARRLVQQGNTEPFENNDKHQAT